MKTDEILWDLKEKHEARTSPKVSVLNIGPPRNCWAFSLLDLARLWRHLEDALHRELGGREGLSIAQLSLARRGG